MGDSNSDSGDASFAPTSFYKQTGFPDTTYNTGGRFSGGLIWTDYVNQCLPVVQSYAVGFGTMCKPDRRFLNPALPVVPVLSVVDQVAAYLRVKKKPTNRATLLWAGANDLTVAFYNDTDGPIGPLPSYLETNTDQAIDGIINCTIATIQTLRKRGERSIIVMNVQPIYLSGLIRALATVVPGVSNKVMGYVTAYNTRLAKRLAAIRPQAGTKVHVLDIHTPLVKALTGVTPVPGITDLFSVCLPLNDTTSLLRIPMTLSGPVCSNRTKVANWDAAHLNTVMHKEVIAKTVIKFLKSKGFIKGCKTKVG